LDGIRSVRLDSLPNERVDLQGFDAGTDISDDNRNTLIRGAGTPLHLLARGAPRPTRFMFRDLEVNFFEDEAALLAAHRIVHPYRRRILNREIGPEA
jgi:hypothetical protein